MIILSGQEIRILDTQCFQPSEYDAEKIMTSPPRVLNNKFDQTLEELESGIRCEEILSQELLGFSSSEFVFP